MWSYRLVGLAAAIAACGGRVRGHSCRRVALLLRLDALGVGLIAAQLVPVLSLGGQGGRDGGVGRQQVQGARHNGSCRRGEREQLKSGQRRK